MPRQISRTRIGVVKSNGDGEIVIQWQCDGQMIYPRGNVPHAVFCAKVGDVIHAIMRNGVWISARSEPPYEPEEKIIADLRTQMRGATYPKADWPRIA